MSRISSLRTAAALFAVVWLHGAAGHAQECALGPIALPALSGPPEWEDFNADAFWRPQLHDPRWSGAPLDFLNHIPVSGGSTAWADDVGVRIVADGKIVYISVQAQVDDDGPTADDYVLIGVSEGSANGAYAFKIAADFTGTPIGVPAAPPPPAVLAQDNPLPRLLKNTALSVWHTTDATATTPSWGAASAAPPTWFKAAVFDRPVAMSPRWAVTVRLDLSASPGIGLGIAGDTRFFVGAIVHPTSGSDVIVGNATPSLTAGIDSSTPIPARSNNWVQYTEPGTACTAGITLVHTDVGVWTGTAGSASGSLIDTICAGAAATGPCVASTGQNVFRVTARKVDNSAGIAKYGVRARIRIADWGSQAWEFGRWRDIATTPPTGTDIFNASVASLDASGFHWLTPEDAGDGTSAATIDYQCSIASGDAYCPKLLDETETPPGSHRSHQCMLVELGQPPPGASNPKPFKVRNNAAYRNMNYENLSTSDVPATISLEGLKSVLGEAKDRDVYLYVESHNLPAPTEKAFALNSEELSFARRFAENPVAVPTVPGKPRGRTPGGDGGKKAAVPAPAVKLPTGKAAVAGQALAVGVLSPNAALANRIATSDAKLSNGLRVSDLLAMGSEQLLDSVWPTYRVRVYVDSGKTFTSNAKTNRVLIPMTPFGFHYSHDGLLYGFTKAFSGMPGVVVEQVSADWFKIHMQSEGSVKVRTAVTAEEKPPGSGGVCPICPSCPPVDHGHCNCRLVGAPGPAVPGIAAGLFVGLAALWRRRRRRPH